MNSRHWLYHGQVVHARVGEIRHGFRYPALFLCFPLQQRAQLDSRWFSLNRWNLFSFHDKDHGDGGDPLRWIRQVLAEHDLAHVDGTVWLHTMPRIFGHVFNPVSFWYCHDSHDQLRAVLCEVNNTFGERHSYLLTAADGGAITVNTALSSRKLFHVSPFFPVTGEYRFRFCRSSDFRRVDIDYWQGDRLALKTHVQGHAQPLDDRHLLKTLARFGWATVLVVLRIHWQALKLWRKKAVFHRKPEPPQLEISR